MKYKNKIIIMHTMKIFKEQDSNHNARWGYPRGVEANELDCLIEVTEFELQ